MESLLAGLWNGGYAPHGFCLLWQPELLWTHVLADAFIAAAYFSIPIVLIMLVRRRRDLAFGWAFWSFATFITACGLTHVMEIVTMWQPLYGLEALIKAVTAAASLVTAALLWPLLPKAVALPSPEKLRAANAELEAMIAERDAALADLRAEIGQRERAEAALMQAQKLEALGQLTGGIAHDFNNLLQAVAGNLELVSRRPDDPDKVVRWSAAALDAVERGRSLSGQLLAFSRKQRLELAPVPIHEMLTGMRDLLEKAVAPMSQVVRKPIDPTLHVDADQLQLELAILNLAFNARDAMPEGGTLTLSAEAMPGSTPPGLPTGDWVAITVSDTGTGMTPEVAARALEPFFTTKAVGHGTGMGLAMVFGVVSQSGGTVAIDTAPGRGARITLYLRQSRATAPRERLDEGASDARVDLTGHCIVLIDDDDQVRGALADTLASAGADVVQAPDGERGIAAVREVQPAMLVVDFAMPGVTGAEVARRVRDFDARLPILVITGFAESEKLDGIEGDVAVLRKPFESRDLLRRIAELIAERRRR